jgi:hypothetical protein
MTILPDGPVLTPGDAEDAHLGDIVARRALITDKLFAARHQLGGAVPVTAADHLEGAGSTTRPAGRQSRSSRGRARRTQPERRAREMPVS